MPKKDKTEVKTYKQAVVNAVILVVVLSLFLYVAIQLSRNFSGQVSTQRTQTVTDVNYTYLDGYVFKDSETLDENGDIIHYLVSNGEKVGVGQAYAEIYSGTDIEPSARKSIQKKLNGLSERIDMLEKGLEGDKNVSDLGAISDKMANSYYEYIDAILGGDLLSAHSPGSALMSSLIDHSSITLSEATENALTKLYSERESLISSIGGVKRTLVSDRSFIFSADTDGYESLFHSSLLNDCTVQSLDSLIADPVSSSADLAGSAIYSSKWQLVLPIDKPDHTIFKDSVGSTYTVELLNSDGISLSMHLERIVADGEDPERAYLILSSLELTSISGLSRHQSVRITLDSCMGYRIPEGAIHSQGDQKGVYILIGNMIEFRRITVIGKGDGYYIVNTYKKDYEEGTLSDIPYLNINDLIVTSGNDLYDGKLLK